MTAAARATVRMMFVSIRFAVVKLAAKERQSRETIVSQREKKVSFRENVLFWQSQNVKKVSGLRLPDTFLPMEWGLFIGF